MDHVDWGPVIIIVYSFILVTTVVAIASIVYVIKEWILKK